MQSVSLPQDTVELTENRIVLLSLFIPASIIGTLTRLGLDALESYQGAPVFSLAYPQFIGCLIMGATIGCKKMVMRTHVSFYSTITTGLCGSITTFSSWQLAIFQSFLTGPYCILYAISIILITFAVGFSGFYLGNHLALLFDLISQRISSDPHTYSITNTSYNLKVSLRDGVFIMCGLLSWISVIVITSLLSNERKITLACVLAPIGTMLRWCLGIWFNHRLKNFPLGTFLANMIGTLVLAIVVLLKMGPVESNFGCEWLQGVADGFCGSLLKLLTFIIN
eukprot:TRINITY_DN15357_c0_g1_i1.p1 TRINITY_DN15357_c0_g1~~TRINITY_DN15357_c0_g1_i1.p1  ORF type:complete len:281 (+),score=8.19 TRINITY_DN15357_c0_g1_i1:80-922(+)